MYKTIYEQYFLWSHWYSGRLLLILLLYLSRVILYFTMAAPRALVYLGYLFWTIHHAVLVAPKKAESFLESSNCRLSRKFQEKKFTFIAADDVLDDKLMVCSVFKGFVLFLMDFFPYVKNV